MAITSKETNKDYLRDVEKRMREASSIVVAVGFPEEAKRLFQPHYENGASIAEAAIWNNYGVPKRGIPERNFMDTAAIPIKSNFAKRSKLALKKIQEGSLSPEKYLADEGMDAQSVISETIEEWTTPPNALATQIKKGMKQGQKGNKAPKLNGMALDDNPLVDTEAMMDGVTYAIRKK